MQERKNSENKPIFITDLYTPEDRVMGTFWQKNPYTLENMSRAFRSLRLTAVQSPVHTNYDLFALIALTWNDLSEIEDFPEESFAEPFLFEMEKGGDYFTGDHRIPDIFHNRIVRYMMVKPGSRLPDIPKNQQIKLTSVYVPFYDENISKELRGSLEEIAERDYTGNTLETRSAFHPSALITVWDSYFGEQIGVQGLKIKAKRGLKWATGTTDENGYVQIHKTFKNNVNYSYEYSTDDMNILNGREDKIGKEKGSIIKKIGKSDIKNNIYRWNHEIHQGVEIHYAHAFLGAYEMYHNNKYNLAPPYKRKNIFRTKLDIYVYDTERGGLLGGMIPVAPVHKSFIELYNSSTYGNMHRNFNQFMFSTTAHEIAHHTHWQNAKTNYILSLDNDIEGEYMRESWALGVEEIYITQFYPGITEVPLAQGSYTKIVRDMIDHFYNVGNDDEQGGFLNQDNPEPFDMVTGYSPKYIQDQVYASTSWQEWETNMRANSDNPTKSGLDDLFDYWWN
ncbi:hypothetical protein [Flagellimonas sp. S3867]|uniref:hypothetical protein n=1 Tax=Flagellimonas sp. S3867 TaxID=2768063 RepID=UPI001688D2FA|nr:hypothetical protein [Flagellimonas sp. S3867]